MMNGWQIVEDRDMVEAVEDWTRVRSPARARRRRHKYPQRIKVSYVPRKDALRVAGPFGQVRFVMHPVTADLARKAMDGFNRGVASLPAYLH